MTELGRGETDLRELRARPICGRPLRQRVCLRLRGPFTKHHRRRRPIEIAQTFASAVAVGGRLAYPYAMTNPQVRRDDHPPSRVLLRRDHRGDGRYRRLSFRAALAHRSMACPRARLRLCPCGHCRVSFHQGGAAHDGSRPSYLDRREARLSRRKPTHCAALLTTVATAIIIAVASGNFWRRIKRGRNAASHRGSARAPRHADEGDGREHHSLNGGGDRARRLLRFSRARLSDRRVGLHSRYGVRLCVVDMVPQSSQRTPATRRDRNFKFATLGSSALNGAYGPAPADRPCAHAACNRDRPDHIWCRNSGIRPTGDRLTASGTYSRAAR